MNRVLALPLGLLLAAVAVSAQLPPVPTADPNAPLQPRLYVAERIKDLGTLIEGDVHDVRWRIENHGRADLLIQRVQASCGCVVPELSESQKVIPPGGGLELEAKFNTQGRHGTQVKSVTVSTNDPAEPSLKLEFTADLQMLFLVKPSGVANLRSVQRGEPAQRTIDIFPGAGRGPVEVLGVDLPEGTPLSAAVEDGDDAQKASKRIRLTVGKDAALGTLQTSIVTRLRVDGLDRTREIPVRAEVVGELTWHPRILDQTRSPAREGTRFAPVTISSTRDVPFAIRGAEAGEWFDVLVDDGSGGGRGMRHSVLLTLRPGLPSGPFATTLNIRTDSLDQPLIQVPVFGIIEPPIQVDPPVVLFRADGTAAGTRRRVKLQSSPLNELIVDDIQCDSQAVQAALDRHAPGSRRHVRFLELTLNAAALKPGPGERRATLTVTTNIAGAERLEIPVIVDTTG